MADNVSIYKQLTTLSEPMRARLLSMLEREELGVGELTRIVQSPQSTVSRHLKQLRVMGWVTRRREGTSSLFRASSELDAVREGLWEIVREQLDADQLREDLLRLEQVLTTRTLDSRAFFEQAAGQWDLLREQLFGQRFDLIAMLSLLPPDLVVADLGCGTGRLIERLAEVVGHVHGVDREQSMLDAAEERLKRHANVTLHRGDLDALPLANASVDAVTCTLVLHHVEDPGRALTEMARAVRPSGVVVVLDMIEHQRDKYRYTMGHHHLGFSLSTLHELAARAGLKLRSHRLLSPETEAQGPPLFAAVFRH